MIVHESGMSFPIVDESLFFHIEIYLNLIIKYYHIKLPTASPRLTQGQTKDRPRPDLKTIKLDFPTYLGLRYNLFQMFCS